MKRTTRNPEKSKREIIEKSAPVFNTYGISGTSMQMLVDATGFQMGGIYRHFNSKLELSKAVFQYNYETLVKPNLKPDDSLNPKEKLIAIFENYKKMILKPRIKGGCPLLNTAMEVDDTDPEFRLLAKANAEEVISLMTKVLEEGKAGGVFKSNLNSTGQAQFLFASVEGAILLTTLTRSIEPLQNIFGQIHKHIVENIFE